MTSTWDQEYEPVKKKMDILWCDRWSEASWVDYLNLINFEPKERYAWIPWGNIPTPENDVSQLCKSELYSLYKSITLKQINQGPDEQIQPRVNKLLHVYSILGGTGGVELYRELVELLAARDFSNAEVLSDIWKMVCQSTKTKESVFEVALDKTSPSVLSYTLRMARKVNFGFWGAWFGPCPVPSFRYCPVTDALLNGKVDHLATLLRNGFHQNAYRVWTYDKVFKASINPSYCWLRTPLTQPSTPPRRKVLTEVLLFLLLLHQCRDHGHLCNLLRCFHLLWGSGDTPAVSAPEFASEVAARFRDRPSGLRLSETPFRRLFRLLFRFNASSYPGVEPRSLQHMCKARLRRSLAQNLPDGVRELPLPAVLRDYLTKV